MLAAPLKMILCVIEIIYTGRPLIQILHQWLLHPVDLSDGAVAHVVLTVLFRMKMVFIREAVDEAYMVAVDGPVVEVLLVTST